MAELTTTSSIVRQAPFLEEIQRKILDQALARGETPIDVPDIQVASQDPLTTQAIETGADDIVDWGEDNAFGEFGNYTGSF